MIALVTDEDELKIVSGMRKSVSVEDPTEEVKASPSRWCDRFKGEMRKLENYRTYFA